MINSYTQAFSHRIQRRANAWAAVRGGEHDARLLGTVKFFQTQAGVLVLSEFFNLPETPTGIFALHIHGGGSCTGNAEDEFADAGQHFNPEGKPHPEHAGDLQPLFSNHGYAWGVFLTTRFNVRSIIGKTVIVHDSPDDFTTQPSGNAGKKIACGVIH